MPTESKLRRASCVEREWSADGETVIESRPYTRVRFVKVYDAVAVFKLHPIPTSEAALEPYCVGLIAEAY